MPVVFTIPWGLVVGPIPAFPIPTKVTLQVCEPIHWSRLSPKDAENPHIVQQCYDEVESAMQRALDALAKEHPYPIVTRLTSIPAFHAACACFMSMKPKKTTKN